MSKDALTVRADGTHNKTHYAQEVADEKKYIFVLILAAICMVALGITIYTKNVKITEYGEEGYHAVSFRAVYEQDGVTVYPVHAAGAFEVLPVAVVYAAVKNDKIISYVY